MQFHLYRFTYNGETFYVSAKNWKDARNVIYKSLPYKRVRLTDLRGCRVNVHCAEEASMWDIHEIIDRGMAWWTCSCGCQTLIALDDGSSCRCVSCGREMRTPTA